jgi:hypothetical protein
MIDSDQLKAKAVTADSKPGKPAAPKADKPAAATKSFSIAEFAGMTYLTEKGVAEWLKIGRLTGSQDDQGAWRIDAAKTWRLPL